MEEMSMEQLEKLASNPFYVLSEKQLQMLEKHRSQQFKPFEKQNMKIKYHDNNYEKTFN